MNTVQFQGESNWDAIVNHNSLDIVEEDEFASHIREAGYVPDDLSLGELERLHQDWQLS